MIRPLAWLLLMAASATRVTTVTAAAAPQGTHTFSIPGRSTCGNYRGLWSCKPCSGANVVDSYFVDDGSGRQRWALAAHASGVGVSIQVKPLTIDEGTLQGPTALLACRKQCRQVH